LTEAKFLVINTFSDKTVGDIFLRIKICDTIATVKYIQLLNL